MCMYSLILPLYEEPSWVRSPYCRQLLCNYSQSRRRSAPAFHSGFGLDGVCCKLRDDPWAAATAPSS